MGQYREDRVCFLLTTTISTTDSDEENEGKANSCPDVELASIDAQNRPHHPLHFHCHRCFLVHGVSKCHSLRALISAGGSTRSTRTLDEDGDEDRVPSGTETHAALLLSGSSSTSPPHLYTGGKSLAALARFTSGASNPSTSGKPLDALGFGPSASSSTKKAKPTNGKKPEGGKAKK